MGWRRQQQRLRGKNSYELANIASHARNAARALSEFDIWDTFLAADNGPQTHRALVSGFGDIFLFHRRAFRDDDPDSPSNARWFSGDSGNLQ
jgi:hypothetical protein